MRLLLLSPMEQLVPLEWMDHYAERDGSSVFLHSAFVFERRRHPEAGGTPQAGGTPVKRRFFLRSSIPCMAVTSLDVMTLDVLPSRVAAAHQRQTLAGDKGSVAAPPLLPGEVDGPEVSIDPRKVFPRFKPRLFKKTTNRDPTIFEVTPSLVFYHDETIRNKYKAWMRSGILVLEMLDRHPPNPHIVKYHGVFVEGDRISGFALDALAQNLDERCRSAAPPLDVTKVINGIKDALTHLHGLGYCHNDVNTYNIMLKADDDEAVLIDFDSCLPEGVPLSKGNGSTISSPDNDWAGLSQVQERLYNVFKTAP